MGFAVVEVAAHHFHGGLDAGLFYLPRLFVYHCKRARIARH